MINMYHPALGDIVAIEYGLTDEGTPATINCVVIKIINNEDRSSVTYDREYWLCEISCFEDSLSHMVKDLQPFIHKVRATGVYFPKFEKVEDIAPYEVKSLEAIELRQKTPKTIVVYE